MADILGYAFAGGLIILGMGVLYLPVFFALRRRVYAVRQLALLQFWGTVVVILAATVLLDLLAAFGRGFSPVRMLNLVPFAWARETWAMGRDKMLVQLLANTVMFLPFGFLLPVAFKGARRLGFALLGVAGFSFLIEFTQYFLGRSADVDDLIQNTLGGVLGWLLFRLCERTLNQKRFWRRALGRSRKAIAVPDDSGI